MQTQETKNFGIMTNTIALSHGDNMAHMSGTTHDRDNKDSMCHVVAPKYDAIYNYKKSCVILTYDFDIELHTLMSKYSSEQLRIFEVEELKIDNAHAIIKEAHIATSQDKIIAIFATSYNHFAQNALLKILEEPPSHIIFRLYVTSKNRLLPTIFSRLLVYDRRKKIPLEPFPLDISRLNIPIIYEYIKQLEKENMSSEQGRILIARLLKSIAHHNITLSEVNLQRFDRAMQSLHVKQSVHLVILPLLLSLIAR